MLVPPRPIGPTSPFDAIYAALPFRHFYGTLERSREHHRLGRTAAIFRLFRAACGLLVVGGLLAARLLCARRS